MLVGMLGTLKAGGAYLALDSEWPTKRLAWVLGDSDARVVLTIGRMQERLSQLSLGIPILALDSEWESIISQAAKYLAATVMPDLSGEAPCPITPVSRITATTGFGLQKPGTRKASRICRTMSIN